MQKEKNDEKKKEEISKIAKKKRVLLKKNQKIALVVLSIISTASIVGGIFFYINMPKGGDLIVGIDVGPETIDPQQAVNHVCTYIVIDQVAEGLLTIDVKDPNNKIIPNLATEYKWNEDGTELTCTLREGVKFHDDTPFNAAAVKWNFDRFYGLSRFDWYIDYLWQLQDGRWIINETQVLGDYTVKFVLNEPYAPFEALLAFYTAYIVSPTSTPKDELIDLLTGDLVGTGPFIYDSYEVGTELRMSPNPNYWGGTPVIDELIFAIINDLDARVDALFKGNLHLATNVGFSIPDALDRIESNQSIIATEGPSATIPRFLGMNNKRIPVEMRKAMAYAFDYDYFIEEILQGWSYRMRSPIPKGILYSNTEDFDVPVLDLDIARQTLVDSGNYGSLPAVDDDEAWEALAENNPIAFYNYTYIIGNEVQEQMLIVCQDCFAKIGIEIKDAGMSWIEQTVRLYDLDGYHRNMLELVMLAWLPDYNDPSTFINSLMSNQSETNAAQINDAQLQSWMELALRETDPSVREQLYYQIQKRFIEELYPWCMLAVPKYVEYTKANLRGYSPNPNKWVFKNAYLV